MIRNPIYIGDFVWKNVYYKGRHDPILPRELFERVQTRLTSGSKGRKKTRTFAFRGLLRCGTCGCLITAERKKGQYTYYRCTRSRGNCHEKPIREEDLGLLGEPLKRLRVSPDRIEWIKESLRQSFADEISYRESERRRLRSQREEMECKIDQLYEDKLNGSIAEDFWTRKYKEFVSRLDKIEEHLEEHRTANIDYVANGARILELAQKAYSLYVAQDPCEQRKILDLLLSNCILTGGGIEYEFAKPFETLAVGAEEEEKILAKNLPFEAANENWLPGLVSQSAVLWDRVRLTFRRVVRGRTKIVLRTSI